MIRSFLFAALLVADSLTASAASDQAGQAAPANVHQESAEAASVGLDPNHEKGHSKPSPAVERRSVTPVRAPAPAPAQ